MSLLELPDTQNHPAVDRLGAGGAATESQASAPSIIVGDPGTVDKRLLGNAIARRRSVPIMGYIGTSGHGKSASLVRDSLYSLALGRRLLSTVEILDAHTGNAHPLYTPFTAFRQLDDFFDGDILMDEITGIMDSHDSAMPKRVRKLLPQMRRRRVLVRWSGIDWDNSNRRLRQMTQAVTLCRGYFPQRDSGQMWSPNRVFRLKTYDAQKMMRSEDAQVLAKSVPLVGSKGPRIRKPSCLVKEWWRGSTSLAFDSYETMGLVLSVDGGCSDCGGRVPETVCKCSRIA